MKSINQIIKSIEHIPSPTPIEDLKAIAEFFPRSGKITALEIGTAHGRTAIFMSELNPKAEIYTIDPFKEQEKLEAVKVNFKNYPNIYFINDDSRTIHWNIPIDFLFIDGFHSYDCVKSDFEKFSPYVKEKGAIAFHDYTMPNLPDVKKYVDELKLPIKVVANTAFIKKDTLESL